MKKAERTTLCAVLINEKQAIENAVRNNEKATQTVTLDQQSVGRVSRIDALQRQQMALALERKNIQRLEIISKTLQRLEHDEDYGFCSVCDEPIGMKRLSLDPTITRCINCAH